MATTTPEKHEFQAEVKQLLDIVIHSLYTDKEIFVRELVSNASDSLEKFRHTQLVEKKIFDDALELEINITSDETAGTLTIHDFGIGMTREELVENLGTIAHSGSKAFLQAIKENKEADANLIGQFGVGFYSAFMVAESVQVYTHSWQPDAEHLLWESSGAGDYSIETVDGQRRGCKIVIKFKDEDKEFAQKDRVKGILERYSSFVQFPINLNGEKVNTVQALWMRNKNEIKDEEYTEFYKFQANAFDEPMFHLHFAADAPLAINALIFVPQENTERWGFGRIDSGVGLFCRKILIDSKPDGLLPEWLRFLKGVVDSADLPLNISRETMQDSALVQKLNRVLTRRFLKFLDEEAKKNPESYEKFYSKFNVYLKEGIAIDTNHREQLGKLLRYESSLTDPEKLTSLADVVSRMKEDQKEIYYIHAPSRSTIEAGPYLETFKARNLEVLFVYDSIDEFALGHLDEFDGKKIVSADQADLELEDTPTKGKPLAEDKLNDLCQFISGTLGEKVKEVTKSKRLVDSPAVVLNADKMMTASMRRMMKSMQQDISTAPLVNLEINSRHTLIKNLASLKGKDESLAKMVVEQIFDNAMVAAGFVEDPRSMVNRVYDILERVTKDNKSSPSSKSK